MYDNRNLTCLVSGFASLFLAATSASAVQFSFLDPGYTQQIYAGPGVGVPAPGQPQTRCWPASA